MTDEKTPSPEPPTPLSHLSTLWKRHWRWLTPVVLLAALALWFMSGPSDREILDTTREWVVSRGCTVTSLSIVERGSSWWPGQSHLRVRVVGEDRRYMFVGPRPFDDTVSFTFKRDPYGKLRIHDWKGWGQ